MKVLIVTIKMAILHLQTNRGGAYDCCQVWVSKAPNTSEGHCR